MSVLDKDEFPVVCMRVLAASRGFNSEDVKALPTPAANHKRGSDCSRGEDVIAVCSAKRERVGVRSRRK